MKRLKFEKLKFEIIFPKPEAPKEVCTTSVSSWTWNVRKQNLDTCENIDEIYDEEFALPYVMDATVKAFNIANKKNVHFLPRNFLKTFPELVALQIWNCSIRTVENHFRGLSKLKLLHLPRNKITHVARDAFVDQINLESLSLSRNRIQFLEENTFDSLKQLELFAINNNRIQSLHPEIFKSLVKVENINLDQNKISAVDGNLFEKAVNLKFVSFTGDKLTSVPNNLFGNNLKLEKIWFNLNNINSIDANMFDHLPNLQKIDFQGNSCVDKVYTENEFNAMKNNLKENCEHPVLESMKLSPQGWLFFSLTSMFLYSNCIYSRTQSFLPNLHQSLQPKQPVADFGNMQT